MCSASGQRCPEESADNNRREAKSGGHRRGPGSADGLRNGKPAHGGSDRANGANPCCLLVNGLATTASMQIDPAVPLAGFVAKLKASDGTLHYVNICSHPTIERPIDGRDKEVSDEILRMRGLENLRVPLLTGLARTVVVGDDDTEAVCIDVVFSPAVLAVALHGEAGGVTAAAAAAINATGGAPTPSSPAATGSISPDLVKFVRVRLVELALKNAEEDLGYKLPRGTHTLPRGVSYKGGVGGKQGQPVPMPQLRKLSVALEKNREREAQMAAPSGPWRSKRDAAGLSSTGKIQELASMDDDRSEKPLLKKGFLNSTKGQIYPEGSSEGMLYGDIKTAGDPLGYLPKGLRSRVNMVDTANTTPEQQQKLMEDYASGKSKRGPADASQSAGASSGVKGGGGGGGSGSKAGVAGVQKGFLNGNGGALYPDGSKEGSMPTEDDALRELIPDRDELKKLAQTTDPNDFMRDLAQFSSVLGLSESGGGMPHFGTPNAHPVLDVSDSNSPFAAQRKEGETASKPAPLAAVPLPPAEATPSHEITEADGSMLLKVSLPELTSLGEAEVEISATHFFLHAPGLYRLSLEWPQPIAADDAKAKFSKKNRALSVTLPLVV